MKDASVETKEVRLTAEGIELVGELRSPRGGGPHPTLCICHGIPSATPAPDDRGYPWLAQRFTAAGFQVMIFNFRGTGRSGGDLDLLGWTRDLKAAIDHLASLPQGEGSPLALMGFSGGAAVCVYVAAHDPRITHLVAGACPARWERLRQEKPEEMVEHFRHLGAIRDPGFPPSLQEWYGNFLKVRPIDWIDRIAPRPLLVLHGEEDDVVPPDQAYDLYQQAGEPKELAIIKGAGHRLRLDEGAMDTALRWLKRQLLGCR